jgi:hypothetical protein
VIAAVDAHRDFITHETLATNLDQHATVGASDALEPERDTADNGGDSQYRDQIEVGQHHVTIALKRSGAPVAAPAGD